MKATMQSEDFNRLIDATKKSCARHDSKLIHMWIRIEFSGTTATAVSVDGYRMHIERAACYDLDESFTAYIKPSMKKFPRKMYVEIERQDEKLFISCGEDIAGYRQPDGEFLDWQKTYGDIMEKEPILRMGFNSEYMYDALSSLKSCTSDFLRQPIILEVRDPLQPAILRTGDSGERVVLPVRLKA